MNLLIDDWIPVQKEGVFRHIGLKTLLTGDEPWQISLPRDDMEMACLQLLVSLTQVLFVPADVCGLKRRIQQPISESEYDATAENLADWFDTDHQEYPFMQCRGVDANAMNPMMKLFAGFTESTSGAFLNEPGLADAVCSSCAVIGLFNQANSCASFCGGAKGSIRGNLRDGELKSGIPITSLVGGSTLRKTIWLNVLTQESVNELIDADDSFNDVPNWVDKIPFVGVSSAKIKQGEAVELSKLGMLRGLFWQPQHIELVGSDGAGVCDCCGSGVGRRYVGFMFEKFSYIYHGFWRHPHSPIKWELSGGNRNVGYVSFTSGVPVWTHLVGLLIDHQTASSGYSPALVVSQHKRYFPEESGGSLLVGGYWTKPGKASINERLHELFSFSGGLSGDGANIERIVNVGLAYKEELCDKLYFIAKQMAASPKVPKPLLRLIGGLQDRAERAFYDETKLMVHNMLRSMSFKESKAAFADYHQQLRATVCTIFEQVTEPYQNEPKMIRALAIARRGLNKSLAELN